MRTAFILVVLSCVCGDEPESVSARVGECVALHTGETKQHFDIILWYFSNTRIALINEDANKSCLYDGEGERFRDRLEVDYKTGFLTITNITAEHNGLYEAEIIRSQSAGTRESMNRTSKCDRAKVIRKTNKLGEPIRTLFVSVSDAEKPTESTKEEQDPGKNLSANAIAGICAGVGVLLIAIQVSAGIYRHLHRKKRSMRNMICLSSRTLEASPALLQDQIEPCVVQDEF